MAKDELPQGRVRRTAKVGTVIGSQGARYAGTRAANLTRSKERAGEALDARHLEAAVKVQYPGIAEALRADLQNAQMLMRMAKALAPGLDARAAAAELKERVLEELDYEFEAQNQRSFSRAYRGHPFIYVPDVITRLSRRRVLVSEWVEGHGCDYVKEQSQDERDRFGEIVFRFWFGPIYHLQHFNPDAHP